MAKKWTVKAPVRKRRKAPSRAGILGSIITIFDKRPSGKRYRWTRVATSKRPRAAYRNREGVRAGKWW